jgi:hypothetical protein
MDTNFIDTMNDNEKAEFLQDVDAAQKRIAAKRDAARLAPLIEAYKKEMIAAGRDGKPHLSQGIRAKYKAQGVPVDEIGFTV